jgi:hypothetical protein
MFCTFCGAGIPEGARFCASCGKPITGDTETTGALNPVDALGDTGPQVAATEGVYAVLVVHRSPNEGTAYTLVPPLVRVGRAADQEVFLDDITVSRRHAEIRFDEGTWRIVDLGSLNGTYVNKVAVQEGELVSGDEVQIGKYRFRFMAGAGSAE